MRTNSNALTRVILVTSNVAGPEAVRRGEPVEFHAPVGIVARFRAACHFEVPIGYQDEAGFHYGTQPVPE